MVLFLDQLQATYPDLVLVTEIGRSWEDRPIMAVRLGSQAAGDADQRPALYVDGQHHAREAVSAQVVLYFLWHLVSQYGMDPLATRLLDTRTVYAIPLVNPDGNDIFLMSNQWQRRTANPAVSDDDKDGLFDEDGREEAGYGAFDVYYYEFDAAWVADHPDDPFAPGWAEHLVSQSFAGLTWVPRYRQLRGPRRGSGYRGSYRVRRERAADHAFAAPNTSAKSPTDISVVHR